MSIPSSVELIHAYRHLYRGLLHAVQFAKPSRYIARDQLRDAFRKEHSSNFDRHKVKRTIEFLQYASQERGLEHRILKSLLHTRYWEVREGNYLKHSSKTPLKEQLLKSSRVNYQMNLAMLNDSMGLCLR
ncbi:hypothetical protein BUE80_DR007932 [Diplocarpon rosae]|nr:hypothetical protein BUE80_DR007932 [Diplocarpon rosae]